MKYGHARVSADGQSVAAQVAQAQADTKAAPAEESDQRRDRGDETLLKIARSYSVSHSTIARIHRWY